MQLQYDVKSRVLLGFILGVLYGFWGVPPVSAPAFLRQPAGTTETTLKAIRGIATSDQKALPIRSSDVRSGEDAGYVADVRQEKNQKFYEVYLVPPQGELKVDYRAKIFSPELTQEFQLRYREQFGYIDTEGLNFAASRFTQFEENRGRSVLVETRLRSRRAFGEYMMRRLGEWHVDNYFKSEPSMRQVYELKERLSSMQVEVGPSTQLEMRYSFADNSAELILNNPYCDSKLRIEMDPTAFGPAGILENRVYVGKRLNKAHYVLGSVAEKDAVARIEWWNNLAFGVSTSLSASTPFRSQGITPRESLLGAAILHSF